jgi:hypothetical protein
LIGAVIFGSLLQSGGFPESAVLSPDSSALAMSLGVKGELAPYRLSHEIGRGTHPKIAVYTPFVRVGLTARAALGRGSRKTDVSKLGWIADPVVLVVFGAPCTDDCQYGANFVPPDATPTEVVVGPLLKGPEAWVGGDEGERYVNALWMTDDLSILDEIGGVPFEHARAIGAFTPESLRPGMTVFARWTFPDRSRAYSGGVITQADVSRWR